MRRDVVYDAADGRQHVPRTRVARIEAPEEVCELSQGDGGVVHDPKLDEFIDLGRRLPLKNVQIDAGIKQKLGSRVRSPNPGQIRIGPARYGVGFPLWLYSPQGERALKGQV